MENPGSPVVKTGRAGACDQPLQGPSGPDGDGTEGHSPVPDQPGRKRPSAGADLGDMGEEVQAMLEHLGAVIKEDLIAKRRKWERITDTCVENTNQKMRHIWKTQHEQRQRRLQEFSQQFRTLSRQLHTNMKNIEEEAAKLEIIFRQRQRLLKQAMSLQKSTQKEIGKLCQQFLKSMEDNENNQVAGSADAQREIRKEMISFQRKLLMEYDKEQKAMVRKYILAMII